MLFMKITLGTSYALDASKLLAEFPVLVRIRICVIQVENLNRDLRLMQVGHSKQIYLHVNSGGPRDQDLL